MTRQRLSPNALRRTAVLRASLQRDASRSPWEYSGGPGKTNGNYALIPYFKLADVSVVTDKSPGSGNLKKKKDMEV